MGSEEEGWLGLGFRDLGGGREEKVEVLGLGLGKGKGRDWKREEDLGGGRDGKGEEVFEEEFD